MVIKMTQSGLVKKFLVVRQHGKWTDIILENDYIYVGVLTVIHKANLSFK